MPQWPLQKDCLVFYGNPYHPDFVAVNCTRVLPPWPIFVGTLPARHGITIHKKCAASLALVLDLVWNDVGKDVNKIRELGYHRFDGSYNLRPIRGGNNTSMHSFAAAIDWDAAENAQHSTHHKFTDASPLIVRFKEEGWVWGGDWSRGSIDAMHVQAARIR